MSGARGILRDVARYYGEKIRLHGPTARGADWNSLESQGMRFAQLLMQKARALPGQCAETTLAAKASARVAALP